jgi:hypothetical protein
LLALNLGGRSQVVPFKFPFNGNYREELKRLENLIEVFAYREVQLRIPGNYGSIWTLKI